MSELYFSNLGELVSRFIADIRSELIIICPYIKLEALKKILVNINPKINLIVVARWRIQDLLSGSSDLEVYEYLKECRGRFFINPQIHLKILVGDKQRIILGSANITSSGLGFINESNLEAVAVDVFDNIYIHDVEKILRLSAPMDDSLFKEIQTELSKLSVIKKQHAQDNQIIADAEDQINRIIGDRFTANVVVADFPFTFSPEEFINNYKSGIVDTPEMKHDIGLFGFEFINSGIDIKDILKDRFLSSNAYIWQNKIFDQCDELLFGRYSALLHSAVVDDLKPYRKLIKELVQNMFNWTRDLAPDFYIKDYLHTHSLMRGKG